MFHSNYRPRMHRLATVHARDNQRPTTNDVTTQPISISTSFTKVKCLKTARTIKTCAQRAQIPPRQLHCCGLVSDSNQHQNFITTRRLPLAHAYYVRSTFVNAFMDYPAHKETEGMNERHRQQGSHNFAFLQ